MALHGDAGCRRKPAQHLQRRDEVRREVGTYKSIHGIARKEKERDRDGETPGLKGNR